MRRLLVLVALEFEARGLARRLGLRRLPAGAWPGFADRRIELRIVGLRAAGVTAWGPGEGPDLVVSAGSCGALCPALGGAGALVVPEVVLPSAGPALRVDGAGHARALAAAARAGLHAATEPLATVEDLVDTPEAKAALARRTGAIAVDMESARIVAAARERGVAPIVVRGVSDPADRPLAREFATLIGAAGAPQPARAAAVALRRPALLGQAWALWRGGRQAMEAVAAVLHQLAEAG